MNCYGSMEPNPCERRVKTSLVGQPLVKGDGSGPVQQPDLFLE